MVTGNLNNDNCTISVSTSELTKIFYGIEECICIKCLFENIRNTLPIAQIVASDQILGASVWDPLYNQGVGCWSYN